MINKNQIIKSTKQLIQSAKYELEDIRNNYTDGVMRHIYRGMEVLMVLELDGEEIHRFGSENFITSDIDGNDLSLIFWNETPSIEEDIETVITAYMNMDVRKGGKSIPSVCSIGVVVGYK